MLHSGWGKTHTLQTNKTPCNNNNTQQQFMAQSHSGDYTKWFNSTVRSWPSGFGISFREGQRWGQVSICALAEDRPHSSNCAFSASFSPSLRHAFRRGKFSMVVIRPLPPGWREGLGSMFLWTTPCNPHSGSTVSAWWMVALFKHSACTCRTLVTLGNSHNF